MSKERMRLSIAFLATLAAFPVALTSASDQLVFENDVLPIFRRYCFACHGNSAPQVGLDLRTAKRAMRGSQNGIVIVPGSPQKSLLWNKISTLQNKDTGRRVGKRVRHRTTTSATPNNDDVVLRVAHREVLEAC